MKLYKLNYQPTDYVHTNEWFKEGRKQVQCIPNFFFTSEIIAGFYKACEL